MELLHLIINLAANFLQLPGRIDFLANLAYNTFQPEIKLESCYLDNKMSNIVDSQVFQMSFIQGIF